ncbi:MAG: esterase [Deltaproteobacteria bacterium]|nr:esterase [Deltaproteobacteria bacterium]
MGAVALVGASLYAGHLLTKPAGSAVGLPPAELGGRSVSFPSASGSRISGWFAAGTRGKGAVLLLHPVRSNRLAMAGRAKFLHALGYAVLLVDLQAHGESPGERITFGYREGMDAVAAIATLKQIAPGEKIGAIGISLGAASLVLSGAHEALSAVVLESMYPTIAKAVQGRLRLRFGNWATVLAPLLLWQLEPRLGVAPQLLRPVDRVSLLRPPVLLVHGTEDRHTSLGEAYEVFERISSAKSMYAVQGAAHVDLHRFAGKEYEHRVDAFLSVLRRRDST